MNHLPFRSRRFDRRFRTALLHAVLAAAVAAGIGRAHGQAPPEPPPLPGTEAPPTTPPAPVQPTQPKLAPPPDDWAETAPRPGQALLEPSSNAQEALQLSPLLREAITFKKAINLYKLQQYKLALPAFRLLHERRFWVASRYVGVMRNRGFGTRSDVASAYPYLLAAAMAGDASAQLDVGRYNRHGWGRPADRGAALLWLTRAVRRGNADARNDLREMAQEPGDIISIRDEIELAYARGDPRRAFAIATDAANADSGAGAYAAAAALAESKGIPRDLLGALPFAERSVRLNEAGGYWVMANLSTLVRSLKRSPAEVALWYYLIDFSLYPPDQQAVLRRHLNQALSQIHPRDRGDFSAITEDIEQRFLQYTK